jgi:hypothetical protein
MKESAVAHTWELPANITHAWEPLPPPAKEATVAHA